LSRLGEGCTMLQTLYLYGCNQVTEEGISRLIGCNVIR